MSAWLERHAEQIEVFYLPPYSPELNPSEYFNGDLKGEGWLLAVRQLLPLVFPRHRRRLAQTVRNPG